MSAIEQRREMERREAEEKQRRKDALAAAHAKALAGRHLSTDHGDAPTLLTLPNLALDAIMRALAAEDPSLAARLACEHSALLAAFGRALCFVRMLSELPAAPSVPLFVHFADLEEWPAAPPQLPRLTLMHAYLMSRKNCCLDDYQWNAEARVDEINNCVILIHELEVDCGFMTLHVPDPPSYTRSCPNCGRERCKCSADGELDGFESYELDFEREHHAQQLRKYQAREKRLVEKAVDKCAMYAAQDARETLVFFRELGLTVVVRKLTFRVKFSRYKFEPDGRMDFNEFDWYSVPVEDWEDETEEKGEEKEDVQETKDDEASAARD